MKTHSSPPCFHLAAVLLWLFAQNAHAQTCPVATPNSPGTGSDRYWSVSWSYEGDVRYHVRWRATGTTDWSSVANQTSIYYLIQGLRAATPYEWQVQTSCYTTGGSSGWSVSGYFTTAAQQPCLTPTDTKADQIADHQATLYWTSAQYLNAQNYELQWRVAGAGSWNILLIESDQSTSTYPLTDLTPSTPYEFRVRAVCSPGYYSEYSAPVQFTTLAPIVCSELTPTGLGNTEITSTNARFNWTDMLPGTLEKYNLRYRPVSNPTWISVANYPANTYPPVFQNLMPSTLYEWQVQTVCPQGDTSPWSALAQFTTLLCEPPIELKPLVYLNNKARLEWSLIPGSINSPFTVRYRTQNPPGAWTTVANLSNGSFIEGLTGGLVYEWQVQKNCTSGGASDWVTGPLFTATDCSYPAHGGVYAAVVEGGSARVNLKWSRDFYYDRSGPNAVTFNLRYRVEGTTNWTTLNQITDTGFNYDLYGLVSNATYAFQLQSNCRAGVQSAFSPSFRYRTVGDGSYYTVKDGDWNDYTVWSNARVPEPDPLFGNYRPAEIRHTVTVPVAPEARASRLLYNGGTLIMSPNARIGLLDKVP